jgi:TolA-binding protein
MTAPELHADDLLDKEARGDLSPAEKSRLDRHVEACSVCRFERQVRDDFRLEFETLGQAARKEASQRSASPSEYRPASGARLPKGRMSSRARLVLLAAAATLVAGVATAEWETIKRTVFSSYVVDQGQGRTETALPAKDLGVRSGAASSPPAEEQAAIEQPSAVEAPIPDTAQPSTVRKVPAIPTASQAIVPTLEPASQSSVPAPLMPDTLFAAANDERQRGAYAEAIRLYRDLSQQFPQSAEAAASHAIVGRLLLDRGDPSGALVQFDEYLHSGMTTLGEEARVGRALALQRLGRSAEEADAWTTLLSVYPQSVHASRARSRLAALGNR